MKKVLEKIQLIFLAGGRSSRLWPFQDKNTFPFLDKPLITHLVKSFENLGFKKIIVVCSQENINSVKKMKVTTVLQKGQGQAAAILSAQKYIKGKKTLILNGSDLFDEKILIKNFTNLVRNPKLNGILVGRQTNSYFPGGYLVVKNRLVKKIIEKPGKGREPSNLVRLIFDYFKNGTDLIKSFKKVVSKKDDLYEQALNQLMIEGFGFKLLQCTGPWVYLKYPWHILKMMDYFLEKIKKNQIYPGVKIDKSAKIVPPIFLGKNVKIFENAKIIGPTFIGEDVVIGNNSLVRQSMIGKNSVVGFGTEIARSYVGRNCWFHSNYIGDSVLEENVSLGAGAVLANLRLDEKKIFSLVKQEKIDTELDKLGAMIGKNVRIGVNANIMPGIKIGKDSFIGAGVLLSKDLPDGTFCLVRQKQELRKNSFVIASSREKFRKKINEKKPKK